MPSTAGGAMSSGTRAPPPARPPVGGVRGGEGLSRPSKSMADATWVITARHENGMRLHAGQSAEPHGLGAEHTTSCPGARKRFAPNTLTRRRTVRRTPSGCPADRGTHWSTFPCSILTGGAPIFLGTGPHVGTGICMRGRHAVMGRTRIYHVFVLGVRCVRPWL